ncbi:hypothetical protein HRbin17_02021 [bacterium HR17]|jgi:Zn-dependent protease with chaperone function|uniref:Peptidase M56 domain-containing protein n=1 Tax=Candidatus Fervidibacter japonicus TaxID=2035412 RepID=A0A2H5XE90_9BACT|nr:hypothetical protein HRbin17_02021 [bacterium HR17]
MRFVLAWLVLWWLVTAGVLLAVGGCLWLLRRTTRLRQVDGAAWANCLATALLLPPAMAALVAGSTIVSATFCAEWQLPLLHACLHTVRHWCGHATAAAHHDAQILAWLAAVWLGIAGSLWLVLWHRRTAMQLTAPSPKLQRAALRAGVPAALPVREALTGAPAGLVGKWRPFIFVARWLVRSASLPVLEAVLRHELMHWQRRDHWTRWGATLVGVVFGCVPGVVWMHREWRVASEEAADDAAAPTPELAQALALALQAVHTYSTTAALSLAGGALGRRIARLQARSTTPPPSPRYPTIAAIGLSTFALACTLTPPLWFTLHCLAEALVA